MMATELENVVFCPIITLLFPSTRNYACFYAYVPVLQCNYEYLFKIPRIEKRKKLEEKIYAKLRVIMIIYILLRVIRVK